MNEPAAIPTGIYAVLPDSLVSWHGPVYFESLALWRETDSQLRASIATQLVE